MAEAGLLDEWRSRFQRDNGHCVDKKKQKGNRQTQTNNRITLKNLSGAFVVLFVGYLTSIFLFIGELILFRFSPRQQSVFIILQTINNRPSKPITQDARTGCKDTSPSSVTIKNDKLKPDGTKRKLIKVAKTTAVVVAKLKPTVDEIKGESSKVFVTDVVIEHHVKLDPIASLNAIMDN